MITKLWMTLIAILLTVGTANADWDEWDGLDKGLFYTKVGLNVADTLQTNYIFTHQDVYYEKNPVINWGVDKIGRGFIPLYFVANTGIHYLAADLLPDGWDKAFQVISIADSANCVLSNHSIGIGFSFEF